MFSLFQAGTRQYHRVRTDRQASLPVRPGDILTGLIEA